MVVNKINHSLISYLEGKWLAVCPLCNNNNFYAQKASAFAMIERGTCRFCSKRHTATKSTDITIYKREDGKWCSICSGCNTEQSYTRKDHAKQSSLNDWQCKICVAKAKGYSSNRSIGRKQSVYNRYKKSAQNRGIEWIITLEELFECYTGYCALTGWRIDIANYPNRTASLDRIDSKLGYKTGNIQWVHSMVNMSKNKYSQELFVKMCKAVADKTKW